MPAELDARSLKLHHCQERQRSLDLQRANTCKVWISAQPPRVINFNDKPILRNPHLTDVVVTPDANGGLLYQISASGIAPGDESTTRNQLLHIIEPISGDVSIVKYEAVSDGKGKVQSYRVWVKRK